MASPLLRLVLDTNTLLRGLVSESSAAARLLPAAEQRQFITLLSRPVLDEYRAVLTDPALIERFPSLSKKRVEITLARLRYCGEFLRRVSARFEFPRDERDAKFIELAIDGEATHIVSSDRDLLSLPIGRTSQQALSATIAARDGVRARGIRITIWRCVRLKHSPFSFVRVNYNLRSR